MHLKSDYMIKLTNNLIFLWSYYFMRLHWHSGELLSSVSVLSFSSPVIRGVLEQHQLWQCSRWRMTPLHSQWPLQIVSSLENLQTEKGWYKLWFFSAIFSVLKALLLCFLIIWFMKLLLWLNYSYRLLNLIVQHVQKRISVDFRSVTDLSAHSHLQ